MSNTDLLVSPSFSPSISGTLHSHNLLIRALMQRRGRTVFRVLLTSWTYCTTRRFVDLYRIFMTRTGMLSSFNGDLLIARCCCGCCLPYTRHKLINWPGLVSRSSQPVFAPLPLTYELVNLRAQQRTHLLHHPLKREISWCSACEFLQVSQQWGPAGSWYPTNIRRVSQLHCWSSDICLDNRVVSMSPAVPTITSSDTSRFLTHTSSNCHLESV